MTLKLLILDREREQRAGAPIDGEAESGNEAVAALVADGFDRLRFLVGERQHRLYPLEVEKIDYIEADGNYVRIRSRGGEYIRRDSIKRLAAYLADRAFIRIERSLLLNVRAIDYAQVAEHGTFAFTLHSGACIQSSASYRETILEVLPLAPLSRRKERGGAA